MPEDLVTRLMRLERDNLARRKQLELKLPNEKASKMPTKNTLPENLRTAYVVVHGACEMEELAQLKEGIQLDNYIRESRDMEEYGVDAEDLRQLHAWLQNAKA